MKTAKFQLSFWQNSTHVSVEKIAFNPVLRQFVTKAIDDIFDQRKMGIKLPESRIPFKLFPLCVEGLKKYNKGKPSDFMVLYYDHIIIGIIREDMPRALVVCPKCTKEVVNMTEVTTTLTKWQKFVNLIFRELFVEKERHYFTCGNDKCKECEVTPKTIVI